MNIYLKLLIALAMVLSFDAIWFTLTKSMYSQFFSLHNYPIALLSWVLVTVAIVLYPEHLQSRLLEGAIVGFFIYGIFNATNFAAIPSYPVNIAILDTLWGTTLCASVRFLIHRLFG